MRRPVSILAALLLAARFIHAEVLYVFLLNKCAAAPGHFLPSF